MLKETKSARYIKGKFSLFFIYSPLIDYKFEIKKNILLKGVKVIQGRIVESFQKNIFAYDRKNSQKKILFYQPVTILHVYEMEIY